LDAQGLAYRRQGNCVVQVQDWARAQALLDTQVHWDWPKAMEGLLRQFHPLAKELCRPLGLSYYWSASESEYATDIVLRDASTLARLYPEWIRHVITTFGCHDVMRYLGRRVPTEAGRVPGAFKGEVISDIKQRQEGVRAKHSVNGNSVKMYDKAYTAVGNVLRVEATTNRPQEFHVFRRAEGQPRGTKKWRVLRRSVADMPRRAEISLAINGRYLAALASTSGTTPLAESAAAVCRPIRRQGRRHRALNPWSPEDAALLEAVSSVDFAVAGLRHRDLQARLFQSQKVSGLERRRRANRITRRLALLRAHGLLRKVTGTHRYLVTAKGRTIITALLAARQANVDQLNKMAA
jgi:predicted pyridoxine 5'-phosphate oxidase superfamily flavin-nucleotide-binding protein